MEDERTEASQLCRVVEVGQVINGVGKKKALQYNKVLNLIVEKKQTLEGIS